MTDEQLETLQRHAESEGARLIIGFPWWMRNVLQRTTLAITLGRRIYLGEPLLHRGDVSIEQTLRHELEHVRQFARYGIAGFLRRYLSDYLRNRRRGMSPHQAYEMIGLEVEARAVESCGGTEKETRST